jgi:hypothetical protein
LLSGQCCGTDKSDRSRSRGGGRKQGGVRCGLDSESTSHTYKNEHGSMAHCIYSSGEGEEREGGEQGGRRVKGAMLMYVTHVGVDND